ncbi:DNA replication/repair protein RecF [Halioxenophilus sp. WMMB6]|uniref:DNA replication/repair protein RecF n=1 Tax=Halioxenophilus sp. WMMB6 TaxID=3073815 RepID=UPI00295EF4F9|nr:DNA replication/repair protein RecF [Halioxenophilus sp. WMMB6]
MIIHRLAIQHFRNIESVDIQPCCAWNIIYGPNGSGKTSLLESISLVAHGKSFRSHLSSPLIQYNHKSVTVFASLVDEHANPFTVGIEKHVTKGSNIKINREKVSSSSSLAKMLPYLVVDGSSFQLIEGASKQRRKLLDWLVFHVEPSFHRNWLSYYQALKQRNALLRAGIMTDSQMAIWDQHCAQFGEIISSAREAIYEAFVENLNRLKDEFQFDISVEFQRGWPLEEKLATTLTEQRSGDGRAQTTRFGPHRADLTLRCREGKAAEILSRGQKKTLVLLMHAAVLQTFVEITGRLPIVGLDDLAAELDTGNIKKAMDIFSRPGAQLFCTVIEPNGFRELLPEQIEVKLFHVERGAIHESITPA